MDKYPARYFGFKKQRIRADDVKIVALVMTTRGHGFRSKNEGLRSKRDFQ